MPLSIPVTSATQQPALKKSRMITSDQTFQIIPLPFPPEPCPVSSLTWHWEWTYLSCVYQQLDHSSKRKHRRSFSGSHLAGEVFLGPPSALQHSRAQSPLPLPGQSAQGHVRKMIGEGTTGANEETEGGNKESWGSGQKAYRSEQTSKPRHLEERPCFCRQHPSLICADQKQPQSAESCCLTVCFMVLMRRS